MPNKKKEGRGAPRKPESEKKNNFMLIGFTKKELAEVKRAAKRLGTSRSRFVAEASAKAASKVNAKPALVARLVAKK